MQVGDKEWGAARPGSPVGSKRGPHSKLEVFVRLRERRGEVAQGRKGSSHPGEDAESLPLGGSRASAARDADPSSSLLPGEEDLWGQGENFRGTLPVGLPLSLLPPSPKLGSV